MLSCIHKSFAPGGIFICLPDARLLNVSNGQKVSVRSHGERQLTFDEVVVRVRNDFALELHIDTEEANAAGLKNGAQVTLIR